MIFRIVFLITCLILISLIVMKCNDTYQLKKYKSSQQTDSVLKAADSIYVIVKNKEEKVKSLKEEIIKKEEKEKDLLACTEKQQTLIENLKKKPKTEPDYFTVVNQTSPSGYGSGNSDGAVGSSYSEPKERRLRYENQMLKEKIFLLRKDIELLVEENRKKDSIINLTHH